MKRFIAMLLLNVHLFNLGGYHFIFQYLINQSDVQIVKQIYENKIDATKLVEIKIPVHMPGIHPWKNYVRLNGQLQLKGVYYNYLRYKMTPDTMSFICIANSVKTRLVTAGLVIAKELNDVPLSKKGHDTSLKKVNSGNDYNFTVLNYQFTPFSTLVKAELSPIIYHLHNPYIELPGQPPNPTC